MSKKPKDSPDKMRPDVAETAFRVMREATGQSERTAPPGERPKNPEAVERGRKGGMKGGPERAKQLTAERRAEIAKQAGQTPKGPRRS